MSAKVLAGPAAAQALLDEAKAKALTLNKVPHAVFVRVGDDPASLSYVRGKAKKAEEIGLKSTICALPEETTQAEVVALIASLNANTGVHGILVQLPLPKHIAEEAILEAIDPQKDIDGFNPKNVGLLWLGQPTLVPCTPAGIMFMLKYYGIDVAGQNVVIVGRSHLVGRPLAALMLAANATVTIAHSKTKDLAKVTLGADILVVAIGRAQFVSAAMVKAGATVIDVGINRIIGENGKAKLVGDVAPDVAEVATQLTPVPGGVGPMTVAQLMLNTVNAAELQVGVSGEYSL